MNTKTEEAKTKGENDTTVQTTEADRMSKRPTKKPTNHCCTSCCGVSAPEDYNSKTDG